MSRIRSSLSLLIGCVWALGLGGTAALAADMAMPVKAPPPPPPPPSWWSGFIEVVYNFGQVNPQGQAVYREGDFQVISGLNLTLYKDKAGFINNVSVGGIVILDYAGQSRMGPADSLWNATSAGQGAQQDNNLYHILVVDGSVTFAEYWTLTDSFFWFGGDNANGSTNDPNNPAAAAANGVPNANCAVISTGGTNLALLGCGMFTSWYWNELKLSLNDGAITHWPISFNPYVIWVDELYPSGQAGVLGTGTSAQCFSCNNQGTDFIIGMVPKLGLQPYVGLPITLSAPTWFTVGPSSFWGAGTATNSNIGVFSTGLTASLAMTWIPVQYGHWNLKAGFQWYDLINNNLIADNQVTYGTSFTSNNILTGFVGVGVGF